MDWQIIGHKAQLDRLANTIVTGKLAHAYIFSGPAGVGKKTIARRLAQALLSGNSPSPGASRHPLPEGEGQAEGYFHPDFIEVTSNGEIKIAQIRELVYKLSLRPYSAAYKVAVIDEAHEMNAEAANALLKSLEEPKPQTIIILITSNPTRLPKTIVSRAQKITFGALTIAELKQLPEMNAEFAAKVTEAEEYYDKVFPAKLSEKLVLAQELASWETEDLKILIHIWLQKLQEQLRQTPGMKVVSKISAVAEAEKLVDQNINNKLLLANLMIKI